MINKIFSSILILVLVISSGYLYAAEETKKPGLGIPFTCEENFPESSRIDYDRTQYQGAYDLCKTQYDEYNKFLKLFIEDLRKGYMEDKSIDWENAKNNLQEMEKIMSEYGRIIIGYGARNGLLSSLGIWKIEVNSKFDQSKLKEAQRHYGYNTQLVENKANISTGTLLEKSSGSLLTTMVPDCKKGFVMNLKTKKCRKILKK